MRVFLSFLFFSVVCRALIVGFCLDNNFSVSNDGYLSLEQGVMFLPTVSRFNALCVYSTTYDISRGFQDYDHDFLSIPYFPSQHLRI